MIFGEGPIIKNIAGDLNKLFLQGTRPAQPIINVEGDAAADQATIQLMADRDPVIRDISTGLGWASRVVAVSGTGALQLVNSLGRPLKSWSVELAPYQEGSGDPSPENVRPIHGTNQIRFVTAGKNLFDGRIEQGNFDSYGLNTPDRTRLRTIGFIPVIAGIAVTITYVGNKFTAFAVSGYVDSNYTTSRTQSTTWLSNGSTVTIDSNINYIRINFRAASGLTNVQPSDISDVMVNFGSMALPFSPYITPSETVITLPQTVYNSTVGSDGGVNRSGYKVFDGSSDDVIQSYSGTRFTIEILDYVSPVTSITDDIIASYLRTMHKSGQGSSTWVISGSDAETHAIMVNFGLTTVAEMRAYLAEHPLEVVYPLATPIDFAVSSSTIPTIEGDGTAWVTAKDGIVTNFSATYLQGE